MLLISWISKACSNMFLVKRLISRIRLSDVDSDEVEKKDEERKPRSSKLKMRAMVKKACDFGVLEMRPLEYPQIVRPHQVLIKIVAAGVNSCDLLAFRYNPGHECSGIIKAVGHSVRRWKVGDKVCAILDGGGYAEEAVVREDQVLPVPASVTVADAASLPYATCIVWMAFSAIPLPISQRKLKSILINGATTAIGVIAIQFAKYKGFKVIAATAGTQEGILLCQKLGADVIIHEVEGDKYSLFDDETKREGVDVVLDCGPCIPVSLPRRMKNGGIRVIVELDAQKHHAPVNLNQLCAYNYQIRVISLRTLELRDKASIISQVRKNIWPAIDEGHVVPVISHRFPLMAATSALKLLPDVQRRGSILLYP